MSKRANGTGTIRFYKGRPKPWVAFGPAKPILQDGKLKMIQPYIGSFKTKKEAELALAKYLLNPTDINFQKIKFGQLMDESVERRSQNMKQQSTPPMFLARKKATPLDNVKFKDITLDHIMAVIDAETAPSTKNNLLYLFRDVFNYAKSVDASVVDLTQGINKFETKKKNKHGPFSREEIQIMRDNLGYLPHFKSETELSRKYNNLKLMDTVLILIYTGCRIDELLELKTSSIDIKKRIITINEGKTENASRIIPIHPDIMSFVADRMSNEYLFCDNDKEPLEYHQYRQRFFKPMCKDFGFKHTIHDCRHSFATYWAANNLNRTYRKKIIGHSERDLTDRVYTHVFAEDLIAEMDKMVI